MLSRLLLLLLVATPFLTFAQEFSYTKDRMEGAILGAALGDAMGRVTEFIPTTKAIKKRYGRDGVTSFKDFKQEDWIINDLEAIIAPYTDDTVMSVIVLEEALNYGSEASEDIKFTERLALRFMELYGEGRYVIDPLFEIRAHGVTSPRASTELAASYNSWKKPFYLSCWWDSLPSNYKTTWNQDIATEGGCGSVMRAWPLGLIFTASEIPQLINLATKQSQLTHRHPMACAASAGVAFGVSVNISFALALDNDKQDTNRPSDIALLATKNGLKVRTEMVTQAMIDAAESFVAKELIYKKNAQRKFPPDQKKFLETAKELIKLDKLLTADMIRYAVAAAQAGKTPEEVLGTNNDTQENRRSPHGFLLGWSGDEAIAAAAYIFVRHPDDLHAALVEAVNTPGDSDSIATLTGALVGSFSGWQEFEKTGFDSSRLENRGYLKSLAEQAYLKISAEKAH